MKDTDFWELVSVLADVFHEEMSGRYSEARNDRKFAIYLAYLAVDGLSEEFDKEPLML